MRKLKPPRVGEAPVAFECKVENIVPLGNGPGAGNLIIAKVILIHIQNKYLNIEGNLDTKKLDLVARMGGSWYCRANESALFEIPKPIRNKGIGVDSLPKSIRESNVLTGNDLGRLGNSSYLPKQEEISEIKQFPTVKKILSQNSPSIKKELHLLAQTWLADKKTNQALKLLLFCDLL